MTQTTVDELFDLAITAENAAQSLYAGLEKLFVHYPIVSQFWRRYANEEAGHAQWLERTREQLPPEHRAAGADPLIVERVREVLYFSVPDTLAGIQNLEDAYRVVAELENSETNAIFEFLIENFSTDQRTQTFLRTQIQGHVGNLSQEFPIAFSSTLMREGVKAQR